MNTSEKNTDFIHRNHKVSARGRRTTILALSGIACLCMMMASCMGSGRAMSAGGEVTGSRGTSYSEPVPYGMVEVKRGFLKVGLTEQDSLWGTIVPEKEISVDGFWMDQTEVTNSMYRQFVEWVRDSIIRERLADPSYGGDETYKIEVDCANCANKMEEATKKTAGVKDATVNFMALKMIVEFEDGADVKAVMQEVVKNCKIVEDDCEIYL